MLRSLFFATILGTLVVGCADPVDSFSDTIEDTLDKQCEECAEEAGITVTQCREFFEDVGVTSTERQCLKDVADRQPSAGPYFDCAADQASEYAACVDRASCNTAAVMTCSDILTGIPDVCPLPSGDTAAEIDACGL